MSKTNYIPCKSLNVPGGGLQQSVSISSDTPVYSTYTGELVSMGPIPYGTKCDAPIGDPNHGKFFHVIEFNPANNSYMAHDPWNSYH